MEYSWSFLVVAVVLVLTPGADFALIVRNSLSGGRRHGAVRGDYADIGEVRNRSALTACRQGFLCNATNPKILVFYLSLLPQFVAPGASWTVWLVHAWTIPVLGTAWSLAVVAFVGAVRSWLQRRVVRRALDAVSGLVLAGFCVRLAAES